MVSLSSSSVQDYHVVSICECLFLLYIEPSSDILQGYNIYKFYENCAHTFVISVTLVRNGYHISNRRRNNSYKYNATKNAFKVISGICKLYANCILQLKDQVHIVTIGLLCVEQEIISLAERTLSPSWYCDVRVAQPLVFWTVFCLSLSFSFLPLCTYSIYCIWLTLWYCQTSLMTIIRIQSNYISITYLTTL